MAIQTSPIFKGFSGSVNRRLLFRQCKGITVLSRFPDRSKVIYSERQKKAQRRFSDAVDFARVVISQPGLKDIYAIKASLLGFRSAWNVAIAEFMSEKPLGVKKKRMRFDKSLIRLSLRRKMRIKLYKIADKASEVVLKVPECLKSIRPPNPEVPGIHRLSYDPTKNMLLKKTNTANLAHLRSAFFLKSNYNSKWFTLQHDNCQHRKGIYPGPQSPLCAGRSGQYNLVSYWFRLRDKPLTISKRQR